MVVLDLKLNNIYGFHDFEINFTYPKKVVHSILEGEHLEGRERFRYKKAVVLMGPNAAGKTSLGRALRNIIRFLNADGLQYLYSKDIVKMASADEASFCIDFVNHGNVLHRVSAEIYNGSSGGSFNFTYQTAEIEQMDSYEKCVEKLQNYPWSNGETIFDIFNRKIGSIDYRFSYPEIESSLNLSETDPQVMLKTLRAVIGTLDPTLQDVSIAKDLKNTFIIRRKDAEIIIQDGKLLNPELLSSGTREGIDVAAFLASMQVGTPGFYYCDEHFSYIQSDIERRIFGLMLDRVAPNGQLIFTTHNTDMLDLNLPKHSYMFLRKRLEEGEYRVSAISASDILKRNTDSVRRAVENDVFSSLPDDTLLDELEEGWNHE